MRRVGEQDSQQFQLTSDSWDEFINDVVEGVQNELGLEECQLDARFYKLLIYEEGG